MAPVPLEQLVKGFRTHLQAQRGLSPRTVRNYLQDLGYFLEFLDEKGVQDIGAVDRAMLRDYAAWLLERGARTVRRSPGSARPGPLPPPTSRREPGLVRRSVARNLSALRSFFRWLVQQGLLPANPARRLAPVRGQRRLPDFLDREAVLALLSAPDPSTPLGLRDRALLELLYASGLRVGEVCRLDLSGLDLEGRQVRVMGKGSRERVVPLGEPARRALQDYLQRGRPALAAGRGCPALFLNRYGERLSARSVQSLVRRYALQAGLSGVHAHTLRHTFATHLLEGGADLRAVQELLGHAYPSTTQVYTHITEAQARRVYLQAHPRARKGAGLGEDQGCRGPSH